jgi:hypothetical protein
VLDTYTNESINGISLDRVMRLGHLIEKVPLEAAQCRKRKLLSPLPMQFCARS